MHKIKIYNVRLKGLMSMFLMLLTLISFSAQAQNQVVSGKVTSATTGETLPGVSVLIKGTATGTVTNLDGDYKISVNSDDDVLVFSFIGMKAQEMSVGGRSTIDVGMLDDITALEEIVVVGYGSQKKSVLTAAISSVKAEDLANFSAGSVDQALQGRMAGVEIVPTSGSPGAGYNIKIRGAGSNGSTAPLYIVDGMRVPDISWLDPFEIEGIEVLKDAASAAIYGAEGANGVVYVTTKKGEEGPGKISYDFQFGVQNQNTPLEVMTLNQYEEYNAEAGIFRRSDEQLPSEGTNWKDEIFDTAPQQRHALTFSGGTADTKYMIGGYFLDQEGIVGGEDASINRYGLRFNISHKVNDWAKISSNYSFAKFERQSIQENSEFGGIVQSGIVMDPATPVTYANGIPSWVINEYGEQNYKTDANGNYWGISTLVDGENSNPIGKMAQIHGGFNATFLQGATAITITPINGLEVTSRLGLISGSFYNHYWQEDWFFNDRDTEGARVSDTYSDYFNYQWENFASYTKQLGNHNVNLLAGTSFFSTESGYLTGNGTTLLNPISQLAYLDAVPNRIQNTNAQGTRNTNTLNSYFGRVTYNYKEKYLLSATMRADGSSVLSEANRWGYFPSVSAGWVLSSEDFFSAGPMNFIKIRASWGQNGSLSSVTNAGAGASLASVSAGFIYEDAEGNFLTGAEPIQLANPNLTWETSEQTDIGLDLGFFEDRLTVSADYFWKTTKDLLVIGSPPAFVGNPAGFVNSGEVSNKGLEIELGYKEQKGDFKYDFSFNFTAIRNEATFVDPNKEFEQGTNIGIDWNSATAMQEGFPIWYFRGYQTDGIFQNDAEVAAYQEDVGGWDPAPGDPIIVDTDGDGTITPSDFVQIGSPHPDFAIGTTIKVDYKGFDFKIFAQGSFGNEVIMGFNRTDRPQNNKPDFFYTDRWTGEGSTNSWFRAGVDGRAYTSDLMVFDGSFFKIRQVQLGYNLPTSILDKAGISKLRLYVSLDNFFTFTKYKGFDPEIGGSNNANSLGIDRGSYPVPKTFVTGLTLQF
ncbi:MAG: TonB-dependent receptor [Reichenbachiella sp.]|uniref:SusC/RagA family TonB-linked outer membrane protein n=1 Tax=Reichenbachiella sp. TaxID=2184521 RepID=UPI003265D21E